MLKKRSGLKKTNQFYVVLRGRKPGLYSTWSGVNGAESQVKGFNGALFKGFADAAEVTRWLRRLKYPREALPPEVAQLLESVEPDHEIERQYRQMLKNNKVVIFTDGACAGNPGPGGYGAVLLSGNRRKELSGGFRSTTNNRMELTAVIRALKAIKKPAEVVVFSDSRYVVDTMNSGRLRKWLLAGWRRVGNQPVANVDLWKELVELATVHQVEFIWVKGHAEYPENAHCDLLAVQAARNHGGAVDAGFEK